jgi:hypothetical protein
VVTTMLAVAASALVTNNPHERQIDRILAKESRKPVYATLPRRNGKRFRSALISGQEFSKLVFTEESGSL